MNFNKRNLQFFKTFFFWNLNEKYIKIIMKKKIIIQTPQIVKIRDYYNRCRSAKFYFNRKLRNN